MSDEKLKNAESALLFMQKEHKNVLRGLHEEIRKLQQNCSDLQFTVTTTTGAAKEVEELQSQLRAVQEDIAHKNAELNKLKKALNDRNVLVTELEAQLKWKEVEWRNQLDSQAEKIKQLQKNLTSQINPDQVHGKGNGACHEPQIFDSHPRELKVLGNYSTESNPDVISVHASLERCFATPVINSLQQKTTSTKSKAFTNKLQQIATNTIPIEKFMLAQDAADHGPQYSKFQSLTAPKEQLRHQRALLPSDYKASVATLPPIDGRPNSGSIRCSRGGTEATSTNVFSSTADTLTEKRAVRRRPSSAIRGEAYEIKQVEVSVLAQVSPCQSINRYGRNTKEVAQGDSEESYA